jgi:hypothetical protein
MDYNQRKSILRSYSLWPLCDLAATRLKLETQAVRLYVLGVGIAFGKT